MPVTLLIFFQGLSDDYNSLEQELLRLQNKVAAAATEVHNAERGIEMNTGEFAGSDGRDPAYP